MKNLNTLEYDKIIEKIKQHAISEHGKAACDALLPFSTYEEAQTALNETESATLFLARFGSPSFGGITDITNSCKRAASGSVLSIKELLNVGMVLKCARNISEFFENRSEGTPFEVYIQEIYINRYFEDKITTAFISEEEVADTASSAL